MIATTIRGFTDEELRQIDFICKDGPRWWTGMSREMHEQRLRKYAEILEDGRVEVWSVVASAVGEIEDRAGEFLPLYCFDGGGGQLLWTAYDWSGMDRWPNTSFELVTTARHGVLLSLIPRGYPLEIATRWDAPHLHLSREDRMIGVIEGGLHDLESAWQSLVEGKYAEPIAVVDVDHDSGLSRGHGLRQ